MGYIDFSREENRILDLQKNLRRHSALYGVPSVGVAVDGHFDGVTKSALAEFQDFVGLPPTGVADPESVTVLAENLSAGERERGTARPIFPFSPGMTVGRGERSEIVAILRILLTEAAAENDLPLLPLGDLYDIDTEEAVILFQTVTGLPVTGVVDLLTWNTLALIHNNRKTQ